MSIKPISDIQFAPPITINPAPLPPTWENLLPEFVKSCFEYLHSQEQFEQQFKALRELKPASFLPFYPILMLLLPTLDDASLERFIKAGQGCDYHMTYACCDRFLKANPLNSRTAAIKEVLKKVYQNEDAQISELKHTLSTSLAGLNGAEASKALQGLILLAGKKKGSAVLQPWVALGWTLKKNFTQAKAAMARFFTLLDRESKSSHLSSIMISFIDQQLEEDVRCPEVEKNPLRLQFEAFIKMHESEALDIAAAKQFVDASGEAFETDPSARVFCYFGLVHILGRLNEHHREFRNLFQSITQLQKVAGVEDVFFIDKNDVPAALPEFQFDDQLHLTKKSIGALQNAITMQCCLLQTRLFDIEIRTCGPSIFLPLPIPKEEFLKALVQRSITLDRGEWGYNFSLNHLRNYFHLPTDQRPYKLDKNFCSRAIFAIFTSSAPQFLDTTLDASILKSYYPPEFKKSIFETYCRLTKDVVKKEELFSHVPLAVRDVLLAASDIQKRANKPRDNDKPPHPGNPYDCYLFSKLYFNWREAETAQEWAERVKTQPFPNHAILKYFQQFWKDFHIQTPFNKDRMPKKPLCLKPKAMTPSTYLKAQAAALLVNAEDVQIPSSATVQNEVQATVLCCLLIDISVDRLVRKAFASGAGNLKEELSYHLVLLKGAFRRLKGNCYQVGVASPDGSIANTYIFF